MHEKEKYFVTEGSIVRKIWGKGDTILFIFAGASAEFALNKAVDWLYFTGRLPSDPLGRLFSTVEYARQIVFSSEADANKAIDKINSIHSAVEKSRGAKIPDEDFRDVLFMLIHYSISAFEILERRMTKAERQELFDVFYRMGSRMNLAGLPGDFEVWELMRVQHLESNLIKSNFSIDLYKQYRKHLGRFRYMVLIETQKLLVPSHVSKLLQIGKVRWIVPLLLLYKMSRRIGMSSFIRNIFIPVNYKAQIEDLDS
jgi:hypothetical protein